MPPTCRHDGSPWTQQDLRVRIRDELLPRAAFLMVRGDWEWLCQCFRFRHFRVAPAAAGVPAGACFFLLLLLLEALPVGVILLAV